MSLPDCRKQLQKDFLTSFWTNCKDADNPAFGSGKMSEEQKNDYCCSQVSCRNPEVLGYPCKPYEPPNTPHFGALSPEEKKDLSWIGVI